jgi:glycosyltransferase involved in cell wall biosynthesis
MKIAVLIRSYDKSSGGAERYCVELTEKLAHQYEVHVFSQNYKIYSQLITFHKIPYFFEKPRFINQLFFSWFTKKLTSNKYDIVHSHELVSHANVYTIHVPCFKSILLNVSGFNKNLRLINTLISPRKIAYLLLEKKQMDSKSSRSYISVSDHLSRNIMNCYPSINDILIAHPGINDVGYDSNHSHFNIKNELSIPKDAFILLLVAKEFKKKGLPTLIKALQILNINNIYLLIAGKDKKINIAIPKELEPNIYFLGQVENIHQIYPEVDILIHPTLSDTFGMAPLEAMSHKIPVIISNFKFCGLSEYLDDSQVLFLTNPRDEIELAKKIHFLYQNIDERNILAMNGYKKSQTITWKKTLEKTLLAYNSISKQ